MKKFTHSSKRGRRKIHKAAQKNSKVNSREEHDRVLIVAEGEKTEINYFKYFKRKYGLSNLDIEKNKGNDPVSVAKFAKKRKEEEEKRGEEYKAVYCVIDRDRHPNYDDASQMIRDNKKLKEILSVPCIEYWFLLHYTDTTKLFDKVSKKSSAKYCKKELERCLPNYEKGMNYDICDELFERLEVAEKNARIVLKNAEEVRDKKGDIKVPCTEVHKLIKVLRRLKEQMKKE